MLLIFNCGDNVEFNSPAFQADRENRLWRASGFSASIDSNGFLTISGTASGETINLIVPSVTEGTFVVGDVSTIKANYESGFGVLFSTVNNPQLNTDPANPVNPEFGEINIDEIDITNGSFTGTFRFLAFDASGENSVGFTNGIFFKVPLISGTIPADPITCTDKEIEAVTALEAYTATFDPSLDFIDSDAFSNACNAYILALNEQRNYCGDTDRTIQDAIDALGECQLSCEQATANRVEAETQYNAATIGNYFVLCAQYQLYLQEQIQFCGDEDGSVQTEINSLNCLDSDSDGVPNVFENFNGDPEGNLDDDDTDDDGTPNYLDNDDDGDGILTQFEAQDENGNPIDTDGDGAVDYLDNDDDGDGILTINENADPNGDGNPEDAVDTDGDGIPDYLQG